MYIVASKYDTEESMKYVDQTKLQRGNKKEDIPGPAGNV